MSRSEQVILTNMCLIENTNGEIVMQIRSPERYSWSGAALPGGHVEEGESLYESVVREVYEETGLKIVNPKLVGVKHFFTTENIRYLVFLYRTNEYEGTLRSSEEGEVKWVNFADFGKLDLAFDLKNLITVFQDENLSEMFYKGLNETKDGYITEYW